MSISNNHSSRSLDQTTDLDQSPTKRHRTLHVKAAPARWTETEDTQLANAIKRLGGVASNWKAVASLVPTRNHSQCLQRWAKVLKPGLRKGQWTTSEDELLIRLLKSGYTNWHSIAETIPGRTSKQARERWFNYLDSSINRAPFSSSEDSRIMVAYGDVGPRWATIAKMMSTSNGRRTAEAVKIRCRTLERHSVSGDSGVCPQVIRNRQNRQLQMHWSNLKSDDVIGLDWLDTLLDSESVDAVLGCIKPELNAEPGLHAINDMELEQFMLEFERG